MLGKPSLLSTWKEVTSEASLLERSDERPSLLSLWKEVTREASLLSREESTFACLFWPKAYKRFAALGAKRRKVLLSSSPPFLRLGNFVSFFSIMHHHTYPGS
jgi:hypothetical protein